MLTLPQPAKAQEECGSPASGTVTCTADGNPYASGITYVPAGDLTLTTDTGTLVTNDIAVTGGGNVTVHHAGTTSIVISDATSLDTNIGVNARSNGGAVSIAATGRVSVSGSANFDGGNPRGLQASGAGAITIAASVVDVSGLYAEGIVAYSTRPGGTIAIDSGAINVAGYAGIYVDARGTSSASIRSGTINTSGGGTAIIVSDDTFFGTSSAITVDSGSIVASDDFFGRGIAVDGGAGSVSIKSDSVVTSGVYGTGITLGGGTGNTGSNSIVSRFVQTSGGGANGIDADAAGDISITSGTVTTTGDGSRGISAGSAGGKLSVASDVITTAGIGAIGIQTAGYGTATTIVSNSVTTVGGADLYGGAAAIQAISFSDGAITIQSGTARTAGDRSAGIVAFTGGDVSITAKDVTTNGNQSGAIFVNGATVNVTSPVGGTIATTGNDSPGLTAAGGTVTVTANGDSSTTGTNSPAITAEASRGVIVTASAVRTSGASSTGVRAMGGNGATTVSVASVAAAGGGSTAISASGQGPVLVTVGDASAATQTAIVATSSGARAAVVLNGTASGAGGTALAVDGATTAGLILGSAGQLRAAGGGAQLTSGTGALVENGGTIIGDMRGAILTAVGGPLNFVNRGTFAGTIAFTDGADRVTNSGTYRASFSQDFGGGSDSFANAGTLLVRPGAGSAGTLALTRLEMFANTGLVDLRNGVAGDVLATSGSFSGSGGSTLAIDVAVGGSTPIADRLVVAGAITGSTSVAVTLLNGTPGLTPGIVFAQGGAGTSATAFTAASIPTRTEFVRYDLAFNAADNSFAIVGTPGDTVARALKINEGAQQLWYRSADTVSTHLAGIRDGRFAGYAEDGGKFWTEIYGQDSRRDARQTITAFGVSRVIDTGYGQDTFGGQIGFDFARGTGQDGLALGVTAGYQSSDIKFARAVDRAHVDAANIGLLAGFQAGGLFVNALGKIDYEWLRAKGGTGGFSDRFHGRSYGAQGEIGYRFGGARFYIEPVATLAYVRTELNRLRTPGVSIDFEDLDGLRSKAGARIGSRADLGGGSIMIAYAQGNYVHEFRGTDGLSLDSNGLSIGLRNRELPDYGEGKIGFSVGRPAGVTGFVEGFGQAGRDYKSGGGRAGLRLRF